MVDVMVAGDDVPAIVNVETKYRVLKKMALELLVNEGSAEAVTFYVECLFNNNHNTGLHNNQTSTNISFN